MVANPCIEVQTSPQDRPSVPAWFAEVVIIARYLEMKGLLDAFAHQVRLLGGRFGNYEPIDFLAILIGYAIRLYSGSEKASLETDTQMEVSPLTMTPTGIESISGERTYMGNLWVRHPPLEQE